MMPRGVAANNDAQGHGWQDLYKCSGPCGFREEHFLLCFFPCILWELMTSGVGPFLTPKGMVSRRLYNAKQK